LRGVGPDDQPITVSAEVAHVIEFFRQRFVGRDVRSDGPFDEASAVTTMPVLAISAFANQTSF
jgi:hypothetical protein